jgi:hypothetical protein
MKEEAVFILDIKAYTLETPDRKLNLRKVSMFADNPHRYCMEEVETPMFCANYIVRDGQNDTVVEKALDFIAWIDMALAAIWVG